MIALNASGKQEIAKGKVFRLDWNGLKFGFLVNKAKFTFRPSIFKYMSPDNV